MIPFSPPYINQDIIDEVVDSMKSGWITTGPKTKQFEKLLADYCNVERVLCLNSATAGLEIILRWFGVKEGDEVIVPAYTYCATANVVLHCGATPVMVDVDDNFLIDLKQVKEAITNRTKVIIPVDVFGFPCDYSELMSLVSLPEIVKKFNPSNENQEKLGRIMVMADSAHSIGAEYKGKKLGSQADAMVFSFHAVKNLTTAEGGAIALKLTGDFDIPAIYSQLCIKTLHGQTKDALSKSKAGGGGWKYDVIEPGYKFNMPDMLAAVGLATFRIYDSFILPRRKEIFDQYSAILSRYEWAQLPEYYTPERISSFHLYPLRIKGAEEETRDSVIQSLYEEGISTNVHFQPLPLLSVYKNLGYKIEDYPVSFANYSREISLPVYPQLSDENIEYVANTTARIVDRIIKDSIVYH